MASTPAPLAHDDLGRGLPVLFLHGFPHDRGFWDGAVSLLRGQVRCIVPDLPGFGQSAPIPDPQTLDAVAGRVVALLDHARIDRAVVVGLSMGGYVALALWRLHPDRVRALVLCDTRAAADGPEAKLKRDAMIALAEREGARAVAKAQLPVVLGRATRERLPATVEAAREMLERQSVAGITSALRLLRDRPDQTPVLATITVPTLCFVGAEDEVTPPEEMEAMAALIPGATFTRMPITGHLAPFEQPGAFAAGLGVFLRELGG